MKEFDDLLDELISENDKIIASVSINGIGAYLMKCELFSVYYAVVTSNGISLIFDNLDDAKSFYSYVKDRIRAMH